MADRYQIRSRLASGGVGSIYRAFDTVMEREVAIKRLLPPEESSNKRDNRDSLLKEAAVLSSLQHPNIVTIYDIAEDDEGFFVVMELLDGKTLHEMANETMDALEFHELASQCLEAMDTAEHLRLLHRDIKPANIMVIKLPHGRPQVKVLDFGLAKYSAQPTLQTMDQNNTIMGSIHFLAPEQFERRPLDHRTDLYSLGCVFYFLLTRRYPFNGENPVEIMQAHLKHHVRPLQERRPDLPATLSQWVMWMINKDVDQRPASSRDALARLPSPGALQPSSAPAPNLSSTEIPQNQKQPTASHPIAAAPRPPTAGIKPKQGTPTPPLLVKRQPGNSSSTLPVPGKSTPTATTPPSVGTKSTTLSSPPKTKSTLISTPPGTGTAPVTALAPKRNPLKLTPLLWASAVAMIVVIIYLVYSLNSKSPNDSSSGPLSKSPTNTTNWSLVSDSFDLTPGNSVLAGGGEGWRSRWDSPLEIVPGSPTFKNGGELLTSGGQATISHAENYRTLQEPFIGGTVWISYMARMEIKGEPESGGGGLALFDGDEERVSVVESGYNTIKQGVWGLGAKAGKITSFPSTSSIPVTKDTFFLLRLDLDIKGRAEIRLWLDHTLDHEPWDTYQPYAYLETDAFAFDRIRITTNGNTFRLFIDEIRISRDWKQVLRKK